MTGEVSGAIAPTRGSASLPGFVVRFARMEPAYYTNAQAGRLARVIPDLVRSRQLLFDLVAKDLKVRYRYALMGVLWAVLEPLFMMLVLTFVFSIVFKERMASFGIENGRAYAAFILAGLIPWQFFAAAVSSATTSLVDNRTLVQKVYFPREVVPLSAIGVAVVNFLIGAVLLLIVSAALTGKLPGENVVWIPLIFAIQFGFIVGLALIFSTLNAVFRDIAYMVEAGILFGFYATPILYPPELVQESFPRLYWLFMANPMASIVTAYRQAFLENQTPEPVYLVWSAVVAAAALGYGAWLFRKRAPMVVDTL